MITGFISIMFFKFVVTELPHVGKYFKELDVLAPSFAMAMIVGFIVSKMYPPKEEEEVEESPDETVTADQNTLEDQSSNS